MEIKYEAVFGPQELFDGMMNGCEFASEEYGYMFANGALYYCERYNEKAGWALSCKSYLTFKPSAMRRIIRTPTWTLADQKAGKMPVSGCKAEYIPEAMVLHKCHVICVNENKAWIELDDKSWSGLVDVKKLIAIESPEEKAQREEDEFVMSIMLTSVHSGTSDEYFMQGARAAYRKLKGGE